MPRKSRMTPGVARKSRPAKRLGRRALAVLSLLAALAALSILAPLRLDAVKDPEAAAPALYALNRDENWFSRELRRFKTYPRLDKAYRLLGENRRAEARAELERYLDVDPADANVRNMLMILLYEDGDFAAAETQAANILAAFPDSPEPLLYRGLARKSLGRDLDAARDFEQVIASDQASAAQKAFAREALSDSAIRQGKFQAALDMLENNATRRALFLRALALLGLGRFDAARQALETVLSGAENDNERRQALLALAETEKRAGDRPAAKQRLDAALALAPNDPETLSALAEAAEAAEDYRAAAAFYGQALVAADRAATRLALAGVLEKAGDLVGAKRELTAVLSATADAALRSRILLSLGNLAIQAGDTAEAASFFSQAAELGRGVDGLLALARTLERKGDTAGAAEALEKALNKAPDAETAFELGVALFKLGRIDQAEPLLRSASRAGLPRDKEARARAQLGYLLQARGDNAGARRELEAATSLGADDPDALMALGETALRLDQPAEAARAFAEAAKAGGDPEQARLALALALERQGRPGQAADIYKELLETAGQDVARQARALVLLGTLYDRQRRHDTAADLFARAHELDPGLGPDMLLKAGVSAAAAGRVKDAETWLGQYLARTDIAPAERLSAQLSLASAMAKAGRMDRAAALYAAILGQEDLPPAERASAYRGLGVAQSRLGRFDQAARSFEQALAAAGPGSPERSRDLTALGDALTAAGRPEAAEKAYLAALSEHRLSGKGLAGLYERLGFLDFSSGRFDQAAEHFAKALHVGGETWRARLNLGQAMFKLGHYKEALANFRRAQALSPDPRTLASIGRAYKELGKPGLAAVNYHLAEPSAALFEAPERRQFYGELAFLLAEEAQYAESAKAYETALALGPDPLWSLALGRVYRLLGQPDKALAVLADVDPERLDTADKARAYDELAASTERLKGPEEARPYLEKALAAAPTADRSYLLGVNARASKVEDLSAAETYFQKASEMEDSSRYLTAQGYALYASGKLPEAAAVFEKVVARDADYLNLWEDLGYIYQHDCKNDQAVDRFKKAIDNTMYRPVKDRAEAEKRTKDLYRMRKEVQKIDTHFKATAYLTYVAGEAGVDPGPAGQGVDVIRSQSGVEAAFIPPVLGFRDDRIFQILGRVNWSLKDDTLIFDQESYQGAVGVRYKPFKPLNFHVGFERLFKIGKASENNWLFRLLWSLSDGYDLKPLQSWWNYTFFYAEYDRYLEDPMRDMLYGEFRQGLTICFDDRWLITPHVVADARGWWPDDNKSSFFEAGVGLSIKYLFNETRYETPRSSFELLMHYKRGALLNRAPGKGDNIDALFVTGILSF